MLIHIQVEDVLISQFDKYVDNRNAWVRQKIKDFVEAKQEGADIPEVKNEKLVKMCLHLQQQLQVANEKIEYYKDLSQKAQNNELK